MSNETLELPSLEIIVAADEANGIGRDGDLVWHLPADLKYFRDTTIGEGHNAVIMGRKTWDSIPDKYRPLEQRRNIVMSRDPDFAVPEGVFTATTFQKAFGHAAGCHKVFCVGGAAIYEIAMNHPYCRKLRITEIRATYECDTFLPQVPSSFDRTHVSEVYSHKGVDFVFTEWTRGG